MIGRVLGALMAERARLGMGPEMLTSNGSFLGPSKEKINKPWQMGFGAWLGAEGLNGGKG